MRRFKKKKKDGPGLLPHRREERHASPPEEREEKRFSKVAKKVAIKKVQKGRKGEYMKGKERLHTKVGKLKQSME